jgi:hypothetical protein
VGHASHQDLIDLEEVFVELRKLPGISERSHGVFYFKRIPFMHFHTKEGKRWADVKLGKTWGSEIAIPFECDARARRRFLTLVMDRYRTQTAPA